VPQHKPYRIEQTMGRRTPLHARRDIPRPEPAPQPHHLDREIEEIFRAIETSRNELAALAAQSNDGSRLTRAGDELKAVNDGLAKATHQVLHITETIDESARTLCATLQDEYKRGLAHEIQENVGRLYESCHFQDISGQRIAKAIDTLAFASERIERILAIWAGIDPLNRHTGKAAAAKLINGPKLDGDQGHASQSDIDRMFG